MGKRYDVTCLCCGKMFRVYMDSAPSNCVCCGSQEIDGVSYNVERWRKYTEANYVPVDHSNDMAVQMFGKRLRDLSPDEKREYNRLRTRESRERRKKAANGEGRV